MEFYTIKDIMNILRVSRNTAYKIVNTENVPVLRIGSSIRIEKSGFDEWLKAEIN